MRAKIKARKIYEMTAVNDPEEEMRKTTVAKATARNREGTDEPGSKVSKT